MPKSVQNVIGWVLTLVGGVLTLFGVWAIGAYFWRLVPVLDEPDKSWIFWGLAVFFVGIAAAGAGIALVLTGWRLVGKARGRD